ncbi:aminopeptidase P N-terminal domain-containing protein [Desulfatirhabdium butyrativorans]|uniref:aminopeptidase P N-terminal domain-containing protein n=1 Tax=Desulfatirhabdium butyrativorans TaxID=340467 RepID=UPI0004113E51|nr:aminopeptidase P N-terminal domain-containing protein [Desulfatirhabdium butyrativorans]
MRYTSPPSELFIENRRRLAARLKPSSIAVLHANDLMPSNADGVRSFIQNADLFYLSGIDQEETILVLFPQAPDPQFREILFIRETSEQLVTWQGPQFSKEEAASLSGIATVRWTHEFETVFRPLVVEARHIFLNTNEHARATPIVETRDMRFIRWCMEHFPLHRYERLAPILQELRIIKSEPELALIREACRLGAEAFRQMIGIVRPGVWEFEIEAELFHCLVRNRSKGPSFLPIIASGPNTCILHYERNERQCQAGELILMDFGAEYANYASDITRTVPVDGRFTPRQRAVYDAVLRIHNEAMRRMIPGNTMPNLVREVGELVESELVGLGLLDREAIRNQPTEGPLYRKYFMHGISHHLGLAVHDVGSRYQPFAPGMVMTCEPGIYIREEGIGIRIENDILLTESGPVNLTAEIPSTAEDIESWMKHAAF